MSDRVEDSAILRAQGLAVGYDGAPLVSGIDLAVAAHGVVTLVGPNGAGKSTLLKTVAVCLRPLGVPCGCRGVRLSSLTHTSERSSSRSC